MSRTAVKQDTDSTQHGHLGLGGGTALYIASVLGTGVIILPGMAAEVAGPASVLSVIIIFLLSIPLAGTFAALASRYPDPGGVASYVRTAFGNAAARVTGYWFYFGVILGAPILVVVGAEYVLAVFGMPREALIPIALALFAIPFAVNWFGIEVASWVQFVLTGMLIAIVIGIVSLSAPFVTPENFTPFAPHGWQGVTVAITMFVWAFAGWEVGTHISAEFRNPRRHIPIATAIAVVVVGLAYLALQWATVGVLGGDHDWGAVPMVDLIEAVAPGAATYAVGTIAIIVCVGVLNTYLAAFGKLGAALAEQGDLPKVLSAGARPGGIPRPALTLTAVLAMGYFGLIAMLDFEAQAFVQAHTAIMVAIYVAGMNAALKILDKYTLGWWTAVLASILTFVLFLLSAWYMVAPVAIAIAGLSLHWLFTRARQLPKRQLAE